MTDLEFTQIANAKKPVHPNFINLTGQRFNRLTVLAYGGRRNGQTMWLCQCTCNQIMLVRGSHLTLNKQKSCGCWRREVSASNNLTHGAAVGGVLIPEYTIFRSAKQRCENPNNVAFANYGERGIEFRFTSFEEFLKEIGHRPSTQYSLDRFPNNDGHYEPGNVRWATRIQQNRNRRNNRRLTVNNVTKCMQEWEQLSPVYRHTIRKRLARGWCEPCAIFNLQLIVCPHIN